MSSIQQNSHSMLGINTLETDEITFGDGTTMSSTSDFASASDLITYTAGSNITISAGNEISSTDTNTEYTAGTNVSISAGNVISATDTDTNTEYTASNNGGLSLTGTEFSLDFSNTNSQIEIPQKVHIEYTGAPQLLVETAANSGADAEISIRGARNATTAQRQAQ